MQKSKCTHLRIRDGNDYNTDVETIIKSIEKEFNIDFRSLPGWEKLVKRLQVSKTDYKRRVQYANLQKATIIDKLYIQSTRPSPFQLSAELARTAEKWRQMENNLRKPKVSLISEPLASVAIEEVVDEDFGEELDALHPNTEIPSSEYVCAPEPSKVDAGIQYSLPDRPVSNLPVFIYTNTHKLVSPLSSRNTPLSYHSIQKPVELAQDSEFEEHYPDNSAVICSPSRILIEDNTLEQQSILFSLTNCTGEYLHIRFKYVTDGTPFKTTKLLPVIPKRLYPGIAVVFKFIFQLQNQEEFQSGLLFSIGHDVYVSVATEPLFIPIVSTFERERLVTMSETVTIPPLYPWRVKMDPELGFPTGILKVSVNDPYSYHLHIHKRVVSFTNDSEVASVIPSPPSDDSLEERRSFGESKVFESHSVVAEPSKAGEMSITEFMSIVAYDIVQQALEVFIFSSTYLFLRPFSKRKIPIYFTKAEHVGYHQSYYDLELSDPKTGAIIMTKTLGVFAEVLPHPIQITPLILDMCETQFKHGYFEDHFIVTNIHKVYPITVYINLTTKIKKMLSVSPMKCVVPQSSRMSFEVRFCSRTGLSPKPSEDLVHFTIKITAVGFKRYFGTIPPIYYELIVPCASEFQKVYSKKYLSLFGNDKRVSSKLIDGLD